MISRSSLGLKAKNSRATQLTFELRSPPSTEDWKPIFITGNFNNWQLSDPNYQLHFVRKGVWRFNLSLKEIHLDTLEYKYVRGSWSEQELNVFGKPILNRSLKLPQRKVIDTIARWDRKHAAVSNSFMPIVDVIEEQFFVPQLQKSRKVYALLPHNYYDQPEKRYPVLYMQDAQNLFNPHSSYGNWAIDHHIAALAERGLGDLIVIAVEHGESDRINEFSPIRTKFGEGLARRYVRFLAETLKPEIDKRLRTLPGRTTTGLGGSSMGGLVSVYGGLVFPHVFGRLMIFSPSFWLTGVANFNTINFYNPEPTRIYFYGGSKEGSNMIIHLRNFRNAILKQNFDHSSVKVELSIDTKGRHDEHRWGLEFPRAVRWLFFENH